jgi:hypothetical protein
MTRRTRKPRLITLIALLFCGSALAHSELPNEAWCSEGEIVAVGSFEFYPHYLTKVCETCAPDPKSGAIPKNCGHFDDDYSISLRTAQNHCSGFATPGHEGDIGSAVPLVESPSSFLAEDHHESFRASQGLRGVCVRCEAPSTSGSGTSTGM